MSDERRWDRDRDWRGDQDRYQYRERDNQRYGSYGEQGRGSRSRPDYETGGLERGGGDTWGGGQSYGGGGWPNSGGDHDRNSRAGRGERDYGSAYGAPSYGGADYGVFGVRGSGLGRPEHERGGGYGGAYGGRDYGSSRGYGYGYGYGRDDRSAWAGSQGFGRERSREEDDRNWFDKAGDEVQSWFGDRDAEHRRQQDRVREGDHRGRGPSGYRRSDERIREDVNDRLSDDSWLDALGIEVTVHDGEVTLNGSVHDRTDKRRAEDLAERVSGVQHVQNNLRVKAPSGARNASGSGQAHTGSTQASGAGQNTAGSALSGATSGSVASSASGSTSPGARAGATAGGSSVSKETI